MRRWAMALNSSAGKAMWMTNLPSTREPSLANKPERVATKPMPMTTPALPLGDAAALGFQARSLAQHCQSQGLVRVLPVKLPIDLPPGGPGHPTWALAQTRG